MYAQHTLESYLQEELFEQTVVSTLQVAFKESALQTGPC